MRRKKNIMSAKNGFLFFEEGTKERKNPQPSIQIIEAFPPPPFFSKKNRLPWGSNPRPRG